MLEKSRNYFAKFEIKSDNAKNGKVSRRRRQINSAIENPFKVALDFTSENILEIYWSTIAWINYKLGMEMRWGGWENFRQKEVFVLIWGEVMDFSGNTVSSLEYFKKFLIKLSQVSYEFGEFKLKNDSKIQI
jgi:hypothetical protein